MSIQHFRHNAFIYESVSDYVDRTVPFLMQGLDDGEAAVVATTRDRLARIREALGTAAQTVTFIDVGSLYTRPAQTVAAYYSTLVTHLRSAPAVRVVAEVQYGPSPAAWDEWGAYEAISNRAYSHLPAWVVCTYSAPELPERMLETVWRTHTRVLTDDWQESGHFEDPAELTRDLTTEPRSLPSLRSQPPGDDLQSFRERLAAELRVANVPSARALDLLVAASEVAGNAWEHGGGPAELRAGVSDGRFVCEISDDGPGFDDPLAGYIAPRPGQKIGLGLWVARQLTWRLEVLPSDRGCRVRLWL